MLKLPSFFVEKQHLGLASRLKVWNCVVSLRSPLLHLNWQIEQSICVYIFLYTTYLAGVINIEVQRLYFRARAAVRLVLNSFFLSLFHCPRCWNTYPSLIGLEFHKHITDGKCQKKMCRLNSRFYANLLKKVSCPRKTSLCKSWHIKSNLFIFKTFFFSLFYWLKKSTFT